MTKSQQTILCPFKSPRQRIKGYTAPSCRWGSRSPPPPRAVSRCCCASCYAARPGVRHCLLLVFAPPSAVVGSSKGFSCFLSLSINKAERVLPAGRERVHSSRDRVAATLPHARCPCTRMGMVQCCVPWLCVCRAKSRFCVYRVCVDRMLTAAALLGGGGRFRRGELKYFEAW